MVEINFEFTTGKIDGFKSRSLKSWLKRIVFDRGFTDADLSFVFVSDEFLLELNRKHLNHDYYTDVITFDLNEENSLRGEIYISVDRVRENCLEFEGGDFNKELCRVMCHGVLHLLGFKDKSTSDIKKMRAEENKCLDLIYVSRET